MQTEKSGITLIFLQIANKFMQYQQQSILYYSKLGGYKVYTTIFSCSVAITYK